MHITKSFCYNLNLPPQLFLFPHPCTPLCTCPHLLPPPPHPTNPSLSLLTLSITSYVLNLNLSLYPPFFIPGPIPLTALLSFIPIELMETLQSSTSQPNLI